MRKHFFWLLIIAVSVSMPLHAQTYTYSQQGANYWGGAYVPPVWTKTYDFNLKSYNITPSSSSTPSTYSSGSSSSSSSGTGYVPKKSKFDFGSNVDYELEAKNAKFRDDKAKEMAVEYGKTLNDAIFHFNYGGFSLSYFMLTQGLINKFAEEVKKNNNLNEASTHIQKYEKTVTFYKFLSAVKFGRYVDAAPTYNIFFGTNGDINDTEKPDLFKLYPLNAKYYYFLDSVNYASRYGFSNYTLKERFLVDLYLIEMLCGTGRKDEAKVLFQKVLNFYIPKIDDAHPFLPQIAINHFYTGNLKEADKLLEYYWNSMESYSARLNIMNELIVNQGFDVKWSQANYPEGYSFAKRNYFFIDSLIRARNISINNYSTGVTYTLFTERASDPDAYVNLIKPQMQGPLAKYYTDDKDSTIFRIFYSKYNDQVQYYLMALLKKGDIDGIRATLKQVYEASQEAVKWASRWEESEMKGIEQYRKYPDIYWKAYYNRKSRPLDHGISFFYMNKFAKAGGTKYLKEAAAPYRKEMSKFTKDEYSGNYGFAIDCGIEPKFMKSRKYPTEVK